MLFNRIDAHPNLSENLRVKFLLKRFGNPATRPLLARRYRYKQVVAAT